MLFFRTGNAAGKLALGLLGVWLLACATSAYASSGSGTIAAHPAVERLLLDVSSTLLSLGAKNAGLHAELSQLVPGASELIDQATGLAFRTHKGRPLPYFVIEPSIDADCEPMIAPKTVLFVGGVHADEVSPLYSSLKTLIEIYFNPKRRPERTRIVYVPVLNPDGLLRSSGNGGQPTRVNAAGIDLNRNMRHDTNARAAIEQPETRFMKRLIALYAPSHIISLHGPFGWLDYDGPALERRASPAEVKEVQEWLSRTSKAGRKRLPINNSYESHPGSLGEFAGDKLGRHVLTIELPNHHGTHAEDDWYNYGDSIIESLKPTIPGSNFGAKKK